VPNGRRFYWQGINPIKKSQFKDPSFEGVPEIQNFFGSGMVKNKCSPYLLGRWGGFSNTIKRPFLATFIREG